MSPHKHSALFFAPRSFSPQRPQQQCLQWPHSCGDPVPHQANLFVSRGTSHPIPFVFLMHSWQGHLASMVLGGSLDRRDNRRLPMQQLTVELLCCHLPLTAWPTVTYMLLLMPGTRLAYCCRQMCCCCRMSPGLQNWFVPCCNLVNTQMQP